jgi:hypothetical protein
MQMNATNGLTFFKGDAAEYTGKRESVHGAEWLEIKMLEGHMAGQFKWVPVYVKAISAAQSAALRAQVTK